MIGFSIRTSTPILCSIYGRAVVPAYIGRQLTHALVLLSPQAVLHA